MFAWKIPKYSAVRAQDAGEHIEALEAEHGKVTPRILLDDSRPEEAVLHPLYEWDDQVAAEKYRLKQSSDIIRNLVIVRPVEKDPEKERELTLVRAEEEDAQPTVLVRAFTSVDIDGRAYMSTDKVVSDDGLWEKAVSDIRAAIRELKEKYSDMERFQAAVREALAEEGLEDCV